jgi:hypothetical protein
MADEFCPEETRPLVRAWIWFWYNDTTRLLLILLPGHLLLTLPLLYWLGLSGESLKNGAIALIAAGYFWAFLHNDYTQLHRIGLSTNRKPLRPKNPLADIDRIPPPLT